MSRNIAGLLSGAFPSSDSSKGDKPSKSKKLSAAELSGLNASRQAQLDSLGQAFVQIGEVEAGAAVSGLLKGYFGDKVNVMGMDGRAMGGVLLTGYGLYRMYESLDPQVGSDGQLQAPQLDGYAPHMISLGMGLMAGPVVEKANGWGQQILAKRNAAKQPASTPQVSGDVGAPLVHYPAPQQLAANAQQLTPVQLVPAPGERASGPLREVHLTPPSPDEVGFRRRGGGRRRGGPGRGGPGRRMMRGGGQGGPPGPGRFMRTQAMQQDGGGYEEEEEY